MWSIEFQAVWKTVSAKIYASLRRSTVACIIRFRPNIIQYFLKLYFLNFVVFSLVLLKFLYFRAILADLPTWGISLGPKLQPGGRFFGPRPFLILKSSHQDLPNKGSNFILSQLEVGHWVAQTWQSFDKLPEIANFGLLCTTI